MEFTTIESLLPLKRRSDHDWRCRCPAHNGTSEDSLSVSPADDGTALLFCHSGCSYQEIMEAVGQTPEPKSNGTPTPQNGELVSRPKPKPVITDEYDYTDENGVMLFQKVRMKPKSFRVRVPNGEGWTWKIGDTRRVIYNLPAVIASDAVFIVEGEKDADRLMTVGLTATCNFDGASKGKQKPKWLEDYNQYFAKKTVYVIPDNDEPGYEHAKHITSQMAAVGALVRMIELPGLPDAGDLSDWLDSGHTATDLTELCTAKPDVYTLPNVPRIEKGKDLYNENFPPLDFLVQGLIARGMLNLIGGRPKSGKSWFVLQMAMSIDSGKPFLGRDTKKAKVLYLALEDGRRRINNRMKTFEWLPASTDFMFSILALSTGEAYPGMDQLRALIEHYDIIFIDTLIATLNGTTNENDNVQMGNVLNGLADLAHDNDVAIVLVHHTGKAKKDDPFNGFRGASSIRGAYDLGMILDRQVDEKEAILHIESRDWEVEDQTISHVGGLTGWDVLGGANVIKNIRASRYVLEVFQDYEGGLTTAQFAELHDVTQQSASKTLNRAEQNGVLSSDMVQYEDNPRKLKTYYVS